MDNENVKKYVIYFGLLLIPIILVAVALSLMNDTTEKDDNSEAGFSEPTIDKLDVTQSFFSDWLDAVQQQSTSSFLENFTGDVRISDDVREYIKSALTDSERTLDPVLCQAILPERVGVKESYQDGRSAQVLVLARGLEVRSSDISVVDLQVVNNEWQIVNIACSSGETAPEREFSFEKEGFLLKSVPPPLNPDYWHIVFEENNQMGHTAPLFFSETSICISPEGVEATCNPDSFVDATKVSMKGDMTESGVEVRYIEF